MSGAGHLCNLVLPGAGKSGTSSLHGLLDQHPQIAMSRPKEPQHFSFDALHARGPAAHDALFAQTPQTRYYGESSQCYMVHPQAMDRIRAELDRPRIILLLREPIARLLSQYRWNYKLTVERAPLTQALDARGEDTGYAFDPVVGMYRERGGYLAFSRYTSWVPAWREAFGEENVLVLRSEDLKRDPQAVVARCFAFLGLPGHAVDATQERNTTAGTIRLPPRAVAALERRLPGRLRWNRYYHGARRRLLAATTPTPPDGPSEAEMRRLREELAADIAFHAALAPA